MAALLTLDPDLAKDLDAGDVAEARRRLTCPVVTVRPGGWDVAQLGSAVGVTGQVRGFLLVSGLATADVLLGGRTSSRIVYPRDVVMLSGSGEEHSLRPRLGWSALIAAEVAVLDDRVLTSCQRWPQLTIELTLRAAVYARDGLLQQAISQIPHVEDRILALFWSVADHRGVTRTDGVFVEFPVSHRAIAQMIGARRPTVSLGLTRLTELGLLAPAAGGWLLSSTSVERFDPGRHGRPTPARDVDLRRSVTDSD